MKITEYQKLGLFRSIATLAFSFLICISVFTSRTAESGIYITTQNLFVILSAVCLGGINGAGSTGIFILAGILGLNVFPPRQSGFICLTNENAGFLWGYFIGALISGIIAGLPEETESNFNWKHFIKNAIAALTGLFVIELTGFLTFAIKSDFNLKTDFKNLFLNIIKPYLLSGIIKYLIILVVSCLLRPGLGKLLYPATKRNQEMQDLINNVKNRNSKK